MQYANCDFCPESGRLPGDRIVIETPHNRAFATLGSMGQPGYVVSSPKEHFSGYGKADEETFADFLKVRKRVLNVIGTPAVGFEHCGELGKSVYHAHYHLVPGVSYAEFRKASESLLAELGGRGSYLAIDEFGREDKRQELMRLGARLVTGLYLDEASEAGGNSCLFVVDAHGGLGKYSRFFRVALADALGVPREEANWKAVSENPEKAAADRSVREETVRLFGRIPGPKT